jgi:kinesin family member 11
MLVQEGTREDIPTGATPRKKVWDYVDHWELTRNRDDILKFGRIKSPSSENFASKQMSPAEDDIAFGGLPSIKSQQDAMTESPIAASLTSSDSSALSIPAVKKGIPVKIAPVTMPLVDTRNVYTTRGSRRPR